MLKRHARGFTIVELLIVIVVIAILAAISVVAYNGIQTRAKNTKTINAAVQWVKTLKLYNADTGSWPSGSSCLGNTTTYGGQCWDGYSVSSSFITSMQPYITNYPEPDATNVSNTNTRRGVLYYTNNSTQYHVYMLQIGSGSCPGIGATYITTGTYSDGYYCQYNLAG